VSLLAPRENPSLFGHEQAQNVFSRALRSGRLPHAWLLGGPPGIGKATLAYRLGRSVLATGAAIGDPNNRDSPLFRRVAHGSEPDLLVLEPTAHPRSGKLRHEITVDQVRAVTAALHETARGQGGRAVVVDTADVLNSEAANAFLKLLEEPPARVVLLLVCHAPGRIPRTLLSRCIRLQLAPLDDQTMRCVLLAAGLANDLEPALLTLANGSPGRYARLAAAGFLEQYDALLAGLTTAARRRVGLMEAAERLAAFGNGAGTDLAADLLGAVVQRGAEWSAKGDLGEPLAADEASRLSLLLGRQPLDRWLALWDKLRRLPFELDQLNVDPRQAYYVALAALTGADLAPREALRA
jgi:DNA polymerase-3 subunit delta'